MRQIYNPSTIDKEARILYELGVPGYEIEDLIMQKRKHELEKKWH
jgi:hypothetical protein